MGLLNNIKSSLQKRLSYNSNTPNRTQNTYGTGAYEDLLRFRHEGKYSYQEYQEILNDTQVGVAMYILQSFLLSKDYTITSASDDPEDVETKEFIEDMFENMSIPFRKVRKDLYSSLIYGFSVLEKTYKINNDNRIVLDELYGIHMKTLQNNPFIRDDYGNLIGIHQQSANGSVDIPIEKVILSTFNGEFDEVEGNSLLNRIAEYPYLKDEIVTWLVTFLHKHENPVTYAKLGSNSQYKNDVLKMLDEIAEGRTSMTIGADDELATLESNHRGESFFNALNYFDNQIFKGLFLGNLLLGDSSSTGSYNQGSVQMTVLYSILDGIHVDFTYDIQKEIDYIISMNFGPDRKSPQFNFDKFTEKDLVGLLNALQPYAQNMIIDTNAAWFNELIGKIVQDLSDIKVDTEAMTNPADIPQDNDVDYGMQPPLPGESEAEGIINEHLKGII